MVGVSPKDYLMHMKVLKMFKLTYEIFVCQSASQPSSQPACLPNNGYIYWHEP